MAYVSSSPHVSDKTTTRTIMLDVIIALLPATIFGIYNFGWKKCYNHIKHYRPGCRLITHMW